MFFAVHKENKDCSCYFTNENIFCEDLQLFFNGKDESYIYAASTRNQQIEPFWSRLKKFRTNSCIDFFKRMVNEGVHRPQLETHVECLLFCFLPIIQLELNDVSSSFERGEYTLGIFIDLSKAFDTADHEILISKLEYYGINGKTLNWLKSYLTERKQCISYSDVGKTSMCSIICGIP